MLTRCPQCGSVIVGSGAVAAMPFPNPNAAAVPLPFRFFERDFTACAPAAPVDFQIMPIGG